jgi:hypothetical protein
MSRSGATAAGARERAPPGAHPIGVKDSGTGVSTDCADKRFQVRGRSFVIHARRNGFLSVLFAGAEGCETARAARLRAACRPGVGPACASTAGADPAAGSGGAAIAKLCRSADPVTSAMNAPKAAAIAMTRCHRRVSPTPRKTTVHRMYRAKIGERFQRAVNLIRVHWALGRGHRQHYGGKTMSGIAISAAVPPP